MRRRVLTMLITVPLLALPACGGSDDSDGVKPLTSDTPSASVSPTLSPTPSEAPLPTTTPEAAKIALSVLGSSVAKTEDEKAAVQVWMDYWDAVSKTYSELEPAPGLDNARGEPLTGVLDYLNELKTKNHRSVGWTRDHVLAIVGSGDSLAIRDCAENFNFEVDAENRPVEKIVPFYVIKGRLVKDGGRWIVTTVEVTDSDTDCRS